MYSPLKSCQTLVLNLNEKSCENFNCCWIPDKPDDEMNCYTPYDELCESPLIPSWWLPRTLLGLRHLNRTSQDSEPKGNVSSNVHICVIVMLFKRCTNRFSK